MANSTKRMAIIGYGFSGSVFHGPLITATPGLEVAAIVALQPAQRDRAAADFRDAEIFADIDSLFARAGEYDGVVVATPNETHLAIASAALETGLAAVIDKPLAPSAAEVRALIAVSERTGIGFSAFQNRRFDSEVLSLKKYLAEVSLGTVVRYESWYRFFTPEVQAGWREVASPATAPGVLHDLGAHIIDQAIEFFGPVASVYAELDCLRPGASVADDFFVSLQHVDSPVRSHVRGTLLSSSDLPRVIVQGTEGSLQIDDQDPQEDQLKAGAHPGDVGFGVMANPHVLHVSRDGSRVMLPAVDGDQREFYRRWESYLSHRGGVPVAPDQSLHLLTVLDAALQSAASGRAVSID